MITHVFHWGVHRKYYTWELKDASISRSGDNCIIVAGEPRTHAQAIAVAREWDSPQYRDRFLLRQWLQDVLPSLDLHYINSRLDCECTRCMKRRAEK